MEKPRIIKFRFQDLKVWQLSMEIADRLFDIADILEKKRLYRFAEQLRGAGMSMANNIAEGSGSSSKKEFKQFLNIARRSTFENANILLLLQKRRLLDENLAAELLYKFGYLMPSDYCLTKNPYLIKIVFALCLLLYAPSPMPLALCS
jgi:four helix bundle protein